MTKDARSRFTLRLPQQLMQCVCQEAEKIGVSINALILQILWEWSQNESGAGVWERSESRFAER